MPMVRFHLRLPISPRVRRRLERHAAIGNRTWHAIPILSIHVSGLASSPSGTALGASRRGRWRKLSSAGFPMAP